MRQCRAAKGALMGVLMGALTAVATMTPPVLSATPGLTASELKAVFLLRLPQFVTWLTHSVLLKRLNYRNC